MNYKDDLIKKIKERSAVVGVIGLGYVGLPLALEFAGKKFNVIGFDTDAKKIPQLMNGNSYIKHIDAQKIQSAVNQKTFKATNDFSQLALCDCIIICVPTPLTQNLEPDLSFIKESGKTIAKYLRPGQLIVLESSTYPGTTEEVLLPLFGRKDFIKQESNRNIQSTESASQFIAGEDFFLAFSPEREDPNNSEYTTATIPKVIGGVTKNCLEIADTLYSQIISQTVLVSSTKTAEAAKLLENIYRSVNIALVNELKMVFDKMGIDIWEVIEAAKTKPFGFQAFYPGPGLGGHCIPIDPFYLTWKAREFDIRTKFIELAGEVNTLQPYYVVEKVIEALNNSKLSILNSKLLLLGAAYKKNIDDMRESPALKLIEILQSKGAIVDYSDPHIPKLPPTRKYKFDMESVDITKQSLQNYNLILLCTDHDLFDYKLIAETAAECGAVIVDTRNAFERHNLSGDHIFKA